MTVTTREYVDKDQTWVTWPDGTSSRKERTITSIDDWRDTFLGRVNFGQLIIGPPRPCGESEEASE